MGFTGDRDGLGSNGSRLCECDGRPACRVKNAAAIVLADAHNLVAKVRQHRQQQVFPRPARPALSERISRLVRPCELYHRLCDQIVPKLPREMNGVAKTLNHLREQMSLSFREGAGKDGGMGVNRDIPIDMPFP